MKIVSWLVAIIISLAFLFLPFLLFGGTLRTNVTLTWSYPTNFFVGTNEIKTADYFNLYSTTNITFPFTNWGIHSVIDGTNRSVTLPMVSQLRFFTMTASNYWGEARVSLESNFSEVVWTPPTPDDVKELKLK